MIRPLATVAAGTLGSRLTGFVRDALIAALLGAGGVADAFLVAFQFINVVRRLSSEGALNATLVPAYLRIRDSSGPKAAAAFAGRALGTIGIGVLFAAVALGLAAPYAIASLAPGFAGQPAFQLAIDALRLMLPYLAFAGPVAVIAAVLNATGRVARTSFVPVLFNLAMIAVIAILLAASIGSSQAALTLAAAVGLVGFVQLAFVGIAGAHQAAPIRVAFDGEMQKLFRRTMPGVVAQSGSQLFLLAGAVIASASPAAVSFLYFAGRLIDLPLGIVGTATGAVLIPRLSQATTADASLSALLLTFGLALPASVGLALLAQPTVALLFERGAFTADDATATALALTVLAASLPAFALARPLGAAFFAREQTRQPLLATLAGLATTIVAGILARPHFGHAGVAAAISLGAWVTAVWLGTVLAARGELAPGSRGLRDLAGVVLATAAMAAAVAATRQVIPVAGEGSLLSRAVALGTLIALGLLVYATALRLLGVIKFRVIRKVFGAI